MQELNKYELNPFTILQEQLKECESQLRKQKQSIDQEFLRFSPLNSEKLQKQLQDENLLTDTLRQQIQTINSDIAHFLYQLKEVEATIRPLFFPWNWFNSNQLRLRRNRQQLTKDIHDNESEKTRLEQCLNQSIKRLSYVEKEIESFDSFNYESKKCDLHDLESRLKSERTKLNNITERKIKVDKQLQPIIDHLLQLESEIKRAENIKEQAHSFDSKLFLTKSSSDRAKIHKQCEQELGFGSPKIILEQKIREIIRINRNYEKTKKRAIELAKNASRTIEILVIDGNNLCYENGVSIGLAALEEIVPALSSDYSLIVVFDSDIRSILKMDDKDIRQHFDQEVKVHIVATRNKADKTILELAENSKVTYVVSNDRYSEFSEKKAVVEERIIRHEIVDGRIFIHDLDVNIKYKI